MSNCPIPHDGVFETSGFGSSSAGTLISTGFSSMDTGTPYSYEGFWLDIIKEVTGHVAFDVAIGAAASEVLLVDDFPIPRINTGQANTHGVSIYFPLHVPQGSRISASCSITNGLRMTVRGANGSPGRMEGFSEVVPFGVSSSRGTSVDPGGTANTKGSWVQIAASSGGFLAGVYVVLDNVNNTIMTDADFRVDIGIGGAGSEVVVIPDLMCRARATDDFNQPFVFGPFPLEIPPSTRLAARAQCSITDATDRLIGVSIMGIR